MTVDFIHGDCRAVLATLPAGRYRTCVTSPPYLWQREYLPAGHVDVGLEIGREDSIDDYVDALVTIFREVRRVLTGDGTLWLNLGDKYANDSKWGGSTGGRHARRHHGRTGIGRRRTSTGLPPKRLIGLPWRVAFALQDDGWVLRAEIIWAKPNVMPEGGVYDRPTRAHETVFFFFAVAPTYYYDADAVREPHARRRSCGPRACGRQQMTRARGTTASLNDQSYHPLGRNLRSVWDVAVVPSDGAHAAPMPLELARRCVLAGSAVGDSVLDPFTGSGTVGLVAEEEGRHATLIDLDGGALDAARRRLAEASGRRFGALSRGALAPAEDLYDES